MTFYALHPATVLLAFFGLAAAGIAHDALLKRLAVILTALGATTLRTAIKLFLGNRAAATSGANVLDGHII